MGGIIFLAAVITNDSKKQKLYESTSKAVFFYLCCDDLTVLCPRLLGEAVRNGAGGGVGAPRSDSQFTFQSYDCSSRASTLPSAAARLIDLDQTGDEVKQFFKIYSSTY